MCISNTARRRSLKLTDSVRQDVAEAAHGGNLDARGLNGVTFKCLSTTPIPHCPGKVTALVAPEPLPVLNYLSKDVEVHQELICFSHLKDNASIRSNEPLTHHKRTNQAPKSGYTTIANAAPRELVKTAVCNISTPNRNQRRNKREPRIDRPYKDYAFEPPSDKNYVTRGGVLEPFPLKLHRVLDQIDMEGHSNIVGWQIHGRCCKFF